MRSLVDVTPEQVEEIRARTPGSMIPNGEGFWWFQNQDMRWPKPAWVIWKDKWQSDKGLQFEHPLWKLYDLPVAMQGVQSYAECWRGPCLWPGERDALLQAFDALATQAAELTAGEDSGWIENMALRSDLLELMRNLAAFAPKRGET